jgi:trk system potassium uptake protein TrkH
VSPPPPEDERSSLAPPPASIPPSPLRPSRSAIPIQTRSVPPPGATRPGTAATEPAAGVAGRRRLDTNVTLALAIALVAAVDYALALTTWASLPLTAVLSLLVVPWSVIVVREAADAPRAEDGTAKRNLAFHFANIALVLAFLVAKWITLGDALLGGETRAAVGPYRNYTVALGVLLVAGAAVRGGRVARLVAANADHPARLMAASFGLTSIVGALLLALPVSLRDPSQVSLVDSLFVSVSAVCVTGLSTVNVAETYTVAGQGVICGLIQVGGLGIMVITAAITILAGRRLGVKGSAALAEMVDSRSLHDVRRTVGMIVSYTLVFEGIGAGLLYLQLDGTADLHGASSVRWAAVFHAISAFCNAGFSIFTDNMAPFVGSVGILMTLNVLVVLGGLGFPVIHELLFRSTHLLRKGRAPRLTLNTRVALATTAMLLMGMTVAYLTLENGASFTDLGVIERINAAFFHSVVARTAGFNVVDVGRMRPGTLLLTCFAMFVGGGSGSIAGGIKVTTLAVLFAAFRGELRAQPPRLFDRTVPEAVVRRAMGVAFLATLLVLVVVFVLLLTEKQEPLAIVFETVSAFSTTGLSTGITPHLSAAAKLILSATMLIGRVGPLTAAVALSTRARAKHYQLPEERLMIG